jgi:hypothetical protein
MPGISVAKILKRGKRKSAQNLEKMKKEKNGEISDKRM